MERTVWASPCALVGSCNRDNLVRQITFERTWRRRWQALAMGQAIGWLAFAIIFNVSVR